MKLLSLALGMGLLSVLLAACTKPKPTVTYPKTATIEHVDTLHGVAVADPYRWLEVDTAADVKAWVTEQNTVTFDYLDTIPYRAAI